jgi:hypothetical protein
MTNLASSAITLVVRLWFERSDVEPGAGEWRGEIKLVPSGQVVHFRGFEGMLDRVRELVKQET